MRPELVGDAPGGDALRQPCNQAGFGITLASLLLSVMGAWLTSINAMSGISENVEVVGVAGAWGGMGFAVLGCLVALIRRPADSE
jgi:hypothetical protein